jgi:5'-3' exonuclease
MGIPVFFKKCIDDYENICFPIDNRHVHNLFFDLNCLIHPCCHNETDENVMLKNIVNKINLIVKLVNPTNFIYIAIDGPCPKPKMDQQRERRYKSVMEHKLWDTNAITPGTKFMNKLEKYLIKHLQFSVNYMLSSSKKPGEGEHKIYDYIRNNNCIKHKNVVYGLDADLIMLSLISNCDNIFLFRERTEFNIECIDSEYIYMDIIKLKKQIIKSIKPKNYLLTDDRLINDYIFICFFLGNDFIKHTPSLILRYNGLRYLLDTYNTLQNKFNGIYQITDDSEFHINLKNFKLFVNKLSENETSRIQNILYIRDKQQKYFKLKEGDDINMHRPLLNRDKEKQIFKNLKYWKCQYYSHYLFNKSFDQNVNQLLKTKIDLVNKKYLESFIWTYNYYIKGCIAWQWSYEYNFAPSLLLFNNYLQKIDKLTFKCEKRLTKIKDQLNYILPDKSHNITNYKLTKNNIDITKIKYSDILKRYAWESVMLQ